MNPTNGGNRQIKIHKIDFWLFSFFKKTKVFLLLVSWNLLEALDLISINKSEITKIKVIIDNWAAEVILFIPIQTLNIPKVRVSNEKYSTVPKSDTTSIQTNAIPAKIAGLAKGKPTEKKVDLLYSLEVS